MKFAVIVPDSKPVGNLGGDVLDHLLLDHDQR